MQLNLLKMIMRNKVSYATESLQEYISEFNKFVRQK